MSLLKDSFNRSRFSFFLIQRMLLGARKKQSIAAILSMALGILPLVLVQEIAIGMIEGMSHRIIETSLYHINARNDFSSFDEDIDALMQSIAGDELVRGVYFELNTPIVVQSKTKRSFAQLRGLDAALLEPETRFSQLLEVVAGDLSLNKADDPALLLATSLAEDLAVSIGDTVQFLSMNATRGSGIPRISKARVSGIFTTGLTELERNWVIVSHADFSQAFPPRTTISTIGVTVDDPFAIQNNLVPELIPDSKRRARQKQYSELRQKIGTILSPRWSVATWSELGRQQFSRLQQTRTTLVVLMVFVLIVASITIAAFLIRLVTELAQQFSILRLMGMSYKDSELCIIYFSVICGIWSVGLSFSIALVVLTFINEILYSIGGLAGLFLPDKENVFVLSSEFYLSSIPVTISFFRLFIVCIAVCMLTLISGYYSAKRLSKTSKVKVLQL